MFNYDILRKVWDIKRPPPLQRLKLKRFSYPNVLYVVQKALKNPSFCTPKIFKLKILFYKKLFDLCQILTLYKTHLEINFLKFLLESDNFLHKKISAKAQTWRKFSDIKFSLSRGL